MVYQFFFVLKLNWRLKNTFSKSSASGSSGFECYNQSVGVGVSDKVINAGSVALPVTSSVSSTPTTTNISVNTASCYKKSHKKTKKSIERSRSGLGSSGAEATIGGVNVVGSVGADVPKCSNTEGGSQTNHNLTQDDKAAKVAALSQALNYIDKFRRNQVKLILIYSRKRFLKINMIK